MAKTRVIALFVLLSVVLLAGNVAAGPGGNRNGDPDGPQITHPTLYPRAEVGSDASASVSPKVVVNERLSYSWQVVLRLYLRMHGFGLR